MMKSPHQQLTRSTPCLCHSDLTAAMLETRAASSARTRSYPKLRRSKLLAGESSADVMVIGRFSDLFILGTKTGLALRRL